MNIASAAAYGFFYIPRLAQDVKKRRPLGPFQLKMLEEEKESG